MIISGPSIPTDGLIFALDAANPRCTSFFPGADLNLFTPNAIFPLNPAWADTGLSVPTPELLDGTGNPDIPFTNSNQLIASLSGQIEGSYSVTFIGKSISNTNPANQDSTVGVHIINGSNYTSSPSDHIIGWNKGQVRNSTNTYSTGASTGVSVNETFIITHTLEYNSGTNSSIKVFVNGSYSSSNTRTNATTPNYLIIGQNPSHNTVLTEPFTGDVYVVLVHSKALSDKEVSQIYNAYRGRFGLINKTFDAHNY